MLIQLNCNKYLNCTRRLTFHYQIFSTEWHLDHQTLLFQSPLFSVIFQLMTFAVSSPFGSLLLKIPQALYHLYKYIKCKIISICNQFIIFLYILHYNCSFIKFTWSSTSTALSTPTEHPQNAHLQQASPELSLCLLNGLRLFFYGYFISQPLLIQ